MSGTEADPARARAAWSGLRELVESEPAAGPSDPARAAARLRVSLRLQARGIAMMRMNLRRADPDAPDEIIERRLRAWLLDRPGARDGDGDGRPAPDRLARILADGA
ncbi:MAG: hypothetical protein IPM29_21420 [Planctomycetes bacterium]|nr:hypothetical protein [Planctomycetota bacterium]